jgi:PadR family transcriptional regulator PadR
MTPRQGSNEPILPGTLDMLVLKTLARHSELHGFAIADAIERASTEVLRVEEGSLYPALQRMLVKGWVAAKWGRTAENRRARYYKLTPAGRRQLDRVLQQYERVSAAIARVLETA